MYSLRLLFFAFLSAWMFLNTGGAVKSQEQSRLVEEIRVIGYRRLPLEQILNHIKIRAGESYDEDNVKRDFQALLDLGQFDKLHSSAVIEDGARGGVVVIFKVSELPVIESIKFYGLPDGLSESEIVVALALERVNIVKGAGFDPVEVKKARRVIAERLADRGWLESGVEASYENSAQRVAITFAISLRF